MTTVEHTTFASPIDLLRQWQPHLADQVPLRELLILGYTVDLAFLERFCIPLARQAGARVTVVGDAAQGVHQAVDVRLAGRAYQHGLAAMDRAFHPKVVVLLGDEQLWIAIGSGNPTMSGWGHNRELWWVLRGQRATGPRAQAEFGDWLTQLPARVAMPSWIGATVRQIGDQVTPAQLVDTHADVHVLHNLDRPIAAQLPSEPARSLSLAAPFFDPSGGAVRTLVDRFRPAELTVGLQTDHGSFVASSLIAATGRCDKVGFRAVASDRTLHGKLVEWTTAAGDTSALVGSPNITAPGLLRAVGDGGNCELAVLSPVDASLFPDSDAITEAQVTAGEPHSADSDSAPPALKLLGCRVDEEYLVVEFVAPVAVAITVETSVDGSPGSWAPKAIVPKDRIEAGGITSERFTAPEVVGGAVRLVAMIGGVKVESAAVFVTDTDRCRPRTDVQDTPRLSRAYQAEDVFTDPDLTERFDRDLRRLLDLSARQRASTPSAPRTTGGTGASDEAPDRWHRFLDLAAHAVGASLTEVVLPGALPSPTALVAGPMQWSVADIGDETELADDESEDAVDELYKLENGPRPLLEIPRDDRARFRNWATKWVKAIGSRRSPDRDAAPLQPAPIWRMTVAALYLDLLAAGVWRGSEDWRDELAAVVQALAEGSESSEETPEEGRGYLCSRVAICLAVLLQDAELTGGRPADVTARRAWEHGHAIAAEAQHELVERMLLTSSQSYARLVGMGEVHDVIELAQDALADPHAEAREALEDDGFTVARDGAVWAISGDVRNTRRLAALGATDLNEADGMVVIASNGSHTTVMLRRGQMLITADSTAALWRYYTVRPPRTPLSMFGDGDGAPREDRRSALRPVPGDVARLADDLGTDANDLADKLRPPKAPARRDRTWDW